MGLRIIGTGRALPQRVVSNDELAGLIDTSDEWISSRSGIKTRRICTEESLAELSTRAAEAAMDKAGLSSQDIDLILCSTLGGDYITPSLACTVAKSLGTHCPALDINAACSGFIYGLDAAAAYLSAGGYDRILIVAADMMSKYVDWTDRATCVLFGDAAGAAVLTQGSALNYIDLTADGNTDLLQLEDVRGNNPFKVHGEPGHLIMQGREVFRFAVQMAERQSHKALASLDWQADDIDYYLLHQANKRIIDSVRSRLRQPEEKFPLIIDHCGNISAASIPVLLDEMLEEELIKPGMKLLLTAFGAGLTTGTCVMTWE